MKENPSARQVRRIGVRGKTYSSPYKRLWDNFKRRFTLWFAQSFYGFNTR